MKTKLLPVLALSTILFTSCNDEKTPEVNDGRVKFSSGITDVHSRVGGAEGDLWNNGDAIGIYMIEHDETLSASSIKEGADNVKYTTASTGASALFASTTPIYYPVNGPLVDFIACHPYGSSAVDENYWYDIDLKDQSNQSAIDLMTASANNDGAGYDKTNTSVVNLHFKHHLAKVILQVKAGDGVNNLTGLEVKVKGMHYTVIFDLTDFSFVGTGSTADTEITPYFNTENGNYELILPPTLLYNLSDCIAEFTVGGNTYVWIIADNSNDITDFNSGEKYTFDVTLTKQKVQVSGTIEKWITLDGGTGTAN